MLTNQPILSLHRDDEDVLWIGTDRAGLHRWHNGKLISYTTQDGLFNDTIYQILEDDGKLWMSSRHGIFSVSKKELNDFAAGRRPRVFSRAYGKADGMASSQGVGGSQPAGCKTRDGKLWFATSKGVVVVDPKVTSTVSSLPPPIVIEQVIADSKRMEGGSSASLQIPPSRGALEFHYTALSFVAPDKSQFKYKLSGYDQDWVDAGTRRVAYYNNLPPGSYVFQVIACNNDGLWNTQGASVELSLLPHFWQRWWFLSACGLGAVGLVGGTARYATKRKLQRQFERLEQQHAIEKERTRIAQDMHDDLGANLSEILLVTDLSGRKEPEAGELRSLVERTAGSVRELVDTLDAIVWAVNPRNDSLEKFALYVSEYVQMYLKAASLRYSLNIPDELPDCMLPSDVRHNLFLVIKEALHNVVKHAHASKVDISLRIDRGALTVTIEDDGNGCAPERSSTFGNGLQNMEDRMKNSRGTFALSSAPGNGTRIQIQAPIGHSI